MLGTCGQEDGSPSPLSSKGTASWNSGESATFLIPPTLKLNSWWVQPATAYCSTHGAEAAPHTQQITNTGSPLPTPQFPQRTAGLCRERQVEKIRGYHPLIWAQASFSGKFKSRATLKNKEHLSESNLGKIGNPMSDTRETTGQQVCQREPGKEAVKKSPFRLRENLKDWPQNLSLQI